jgi:hypothetical protein
MGLLVSFACRQADLGDMTAERHSVAVTIATWTSDASPWSGQDVSMWADFMATYREQPMKKVANQI